MKRSKKTAYQYRYHGKGSIKIHIPKFLRTLAFILLLAAIILFLSALSLKKYMVFSRDGGKLVLPGEVSESEETEPAADPMIGLTVVEEQEEIPVQEKETLRAVRISITDLISGNASAILQDSNANALIVTMKDSTGTLFWNSAQSISGELPPISESASSVQSALQDCTANGLYMIAEVDCFNDAYLGSNESYALLDSDGNPLGWADPSMAAVQDYIAGAAAELGTLGFDELLFTDISYPDNYELDSAMRYDSVSGFLNTLAIALTSSAPSSEDLLCSKLGCRPLVGLTVGSSVFTSGDDPLSGLDITELLSHADRLWCSSEIDSASISMLTSEELSGGDAVLPVSSFDSVNDCSQVLLPQEFPEEISEEIPAVE